ncbi:TonB-dependent receptor, partial [Xenorhabdus sp. XENO-7]
YHYTPFSELVDTKLLLSSSKGQQDFENRTMGVLGESESKNQSNAIDISNTSRLNYADTDFAFTLGSKWMNTEYRKKISTKIESEKVAGEAIENNPFAPSGKQNIASIYSRLKIEHGIYTADLVLNYIDYSVKGIKPACEERINCFPQGEAKINLKERGFNPGILLSAEIIPEFQPFVSYTHSMRAPNIQEIFHTNDGGNSVNPFLKGEKADTYQIGFNSYRPNLIVDGDTFRLKTTLFYTKIKNYITSDQYMLCIEKRMCKVGGALTDEEQNALNPNVSSYIYTNSLTPVNMRGYEISANYDSGIFYSSLAYSQQKTQQPTSIATTYFGASPASQLPERYITLDTGVRFFDEKLRVGAIVKYTGESYRQSPSGEPDDDNNIVMQKEDKIPTIIDLYSDYKINKNLFINFSIQNLMNKNYSEALNRMNSAPIMEDQNARTQTARGRTYVIGAEVRF